MARSLAKTIENPGGLGSPPYLMPKERNDADGLPLTRPTAGIRLARVVAKTDDLECWRAHACTNRL
jgi:hypothetical protein